MRYGEVSFDFTDNDDLKKQLEKVDFDAIAKTITEKVSTLVLESRQVREEIRDLVDTDGRFMIFKIAPEKKIDIVMLAIYAYGTSATLDEIRHTTGIADPSGDAINSGSSRKYFMTIDKQRQIYGLGTDGLQEVTTEILPSLRQEHDDDTDKGKGSQ